MAADLSVQATHTIHGAAPANGRYAMLKLSDGSFGFSRPRASNWSSVMPSFFWHRHRDILDEGRGETVKAGGHCLWVVKRFPLE